MIMRTLIYLLVHTSRFTVVPVVAFKSKANAEAYLKNKEDKDKNYHGYIITIPLENEE